jgi:Tfp pilus assembly protein PilO
VGFVMHGAQAVWAERLGAPGVAAAGVLAFCLVLFLSASWPLQQEILRLDAERVRALQGSSDSPRDAARQLDQLLGQLPREAELSTRLAELHALARRQGVVLRRASFDVTTEKHGRLLRQQMSFQTRADYPALRRFLREALAAMPALALEEVEIARPALGEAGTVEASLRFSLLLARGEAK